MTEVLIERLLTAMNNISGLRVGNFFKVSVVCAIDDPHFLKPSPALAVKVIADELLYANRLLSRICPTLQLHPNHLLQFDLIDHADVNASAQ